MYTGNYCLNVSYRTFDSFIHLGIPPTGSAGRMKLSCVVCASVVLMVNKHLTHSYILRKDPPPLCEHCPCILPVRHILVESNHYDQEGKDMGFLEDQE